MDFFLIHVQELLRLANAGGVDDYLPPILPPDFTPHVFPPVEQVEQNELLPVHDSAEFFFRVCRVVHRQLMGEHARCAGHVHCDQESHVPPLSFLRTTDPSIFFFHLEKRPPGSGDLLLAAPMCF